MCSYLYAAFSLKTNKQLSNLSTDEKKLVRKWRQAIMSVAIEEMVHLVLVSNLSIALGGRPHLARPNFPVEPGYFPSGVVIKLVPFSRSTLKHFVYLERPEGVALSDAGNFAARKQYRRATPGPGLMPSAQEYRTVGHLYAALAKNLKASARRLGESKLFIGRRSAQIGQSDLKVHGVREIVDLASALQAIETIIEQGEGSPIHREGSHYERFRQIQREFERACARNKAFRPAWPAVTSPVMRKPPRPRGLTYVNDTSTAKVLDLANAVYCQIVRCLGQSLGRSGRRGSATKGAYLNIAVRLMHVLTAISDVLVTMRATQARKGNAGVTFTTLRGVEPFFGGEPETQITLERLDELARGAKQLPSPRRFKPVTAQLRAVSRHARKELA